MGINLKLRSIFTQSQGETHVPWAVTVGGQTYIINSDAPARALDLLHPYLREDVWQALLDGQP